SGPIAAFDPYVLEWHHAAKSDRPSGTARELLRRIVAAHPRKRGVRDLDADGPADPELVEVAVLRAGAGPGMHLVGFDAPGETLELRLTARDRSAYAAGAVAAADWLTARPRSPGIHPFDEVVDDLLAAPVPAALPARPRPQTRLNPTPKETSDDQLPPPRATPPPAAPRCIHRPRHAIHARRRRRRDGIPAARQLAGPGRDRRARAVRHDRRSAHPQPRRTRSADRDHARDCRRATVAGPDR